MTSRTVVPGVFGRVSALLRLDQGMLVNGFWRISVGVLVEGVCAPTLTSLQERAQTDLEIAAAATKLQGLACALVLRRHLRKQRST